MRPDRKLRQTVVGRCSPSFCLDADHDGFIDDCVLACVVVTLSRRVYKELQVLEAGFRNIVRYKHVSEADHLRLKLASTDADRRKRLWLDFRRGSVTVSQRTVLITF